MIEKVCPICNATFLAKTSRRIYCSTVCSKEAEKLRNKQHTLEHRLAGKQCEKCSKTFIPKQYGMTRRYCFECVPDGLSNGVDIRRLIKQWALDYKGYKCSRCGYNKCLEALEFHHQDMTQKEFSISDRDIKLDWKNIRQELDKCELVCANCHREIHCESEHRIIQKE